MKSSIFSYHLVLSEEQLDFPFVYAIAKQGIAKSDLKDESTSLIPLLDNIINHVPVPTADINAPFQMLISAIDYNDYLGRIGIGRIHNGVIKTGGNIVLITREGKRVNSKVTKMYSFENIKRVDVDELSAGDIGAIAGFEDVDIGDTFASPEKPEALPFVQ